MSPDIAKKLNNPVVQKALGFWANKVATLLINGKSERQVKYWINRSLNNKLSPHGLELIWQMGLVKYEELKKKVGAIVITSA